MKYALNLTNNNGTRTGWIIDNSNLYTVEVYYSEGRWHYGKKPIKRIDGIWRDR
jgi:hypothetical protein